MAHRIHSVKAKRYVRIAQMAGLALGMSAAFLWAVDVPGLGHQQPKPPEVRPVVQAQEESAAEMRFEPERTEDMAVRLEMGRRAAPEPPKQQAENKKPEEPKAPEPQASGPSIAYLGPIYETNRMLAVVSIDGRQRIVPEGRRIGDSRLTAIRDHEIVLEEAGGQRKIALGDRTGPAVSWLGTLPTGPGASVHSANARRAAVVQGRQQGARTAASGGFSPEMEQRFRERGIDPAQAARWREMMRERQAGRINTNVPPGMSVAEAPATEEQMTRIEMEDEELLIQLEEDGELNEELMMRLGEDGDEEELRRILEGGDLDDDERMRR